MTTVNENRRPLKSRSIQFFHQLARWLVAIGLHANHVSILSMVFAAAAGIAFWLAGTSEHPILFCVLAIFGIQMRLLCNLVDGLMAVEGGLKTPTGEIYNDLPDRISDVAIILGFAYGAQTQFSITLGWLAALGAVMTAYIRLLGASLGVGHTFAGPQAKPHRMFTLTLAAIIWAVEQSITDGSHSVFFTLLFVNFGIFVTCVRRLKYIASELKK